jgi:hypothetical protein
MKGMTRITRYASLLLAGAALVAGCEGNGKVGGYDPKAHVEKDAAEAKIAGKARPEYYEVKGKDGMIYVAGSKDSAARIEAGQKFAMQKKAFGYGPNRETVVFEENKDGIADFLEVEYKKRHPLN